MPAILFLCSLVLSAADPAQTPPVPNEDQRTDTSLLSPHASSPLENRPRLVNRWEPSNWLLIGRCRSLLCEDRILSDQVIHVDAVGGALTLEGVVASAAIKERATLVAAKTHGSRSVHNLLQVRENPRSAPLRLTLGRSAWQGADGTSQTRPPLASSGWDIPSLERSSPGKFGLEDRPGPCLPVIASTTRSENRAIDDPMVVPSAGSDAAAQQTIVLRKPVPVLGPFVRAFPSMPIVTEHERIIRPGLPVVLTYVVDVGGATGNTALAGPVLPPEGWQGCQERFLTHP